MPSIIAMILNVQMIKEYFKGQLSRQSILASRVWPKLRAGIVNKRKNDFPWRHHINLIYVGLYAIKFNTELDNVPNLQSKSNLLIRQMEPIQVYAMCSQPTTSKSAHPSWWSSPWKRCCLDCCFFWSILCQVHPGVHPCAPEWPENPNFWSRLFETWNQQLC